MSHENLGSRLGVRGSKHKNPGEASGITLLCYKKTFRVDRSTVDAHLVMQSDAGLAATLGNERNRVATGNLLARLDQRGT